MQCAYEQCCRLYEYVCMYVCMYVCTYVCMYVHTYMGMVDPHQTSLLQFQCSICGRPSHSGSACQSANTHQEVNNSDCVTTSHMHTYCTCLHTHTSTHTHSTCIRTYIHTCVCTYAHAHSSTSFSCNSQCNTWKKPIRIYVCMYVPTYVHTYVCTYVISKRMYYTHTQTHTHTHTHTHTAPLLPPYLVREDVVNLSELLIQSGGPCLGSDVLLLVVHGGVPVDEVGLAQPDQFNTAETGEGHGYMGGAWRQGRDMETCLCIDTHVRVCT